MTDIELALGYVGFAVAVLGTCAAVPAATWRVVERSRAGVVGAINRLLRRRITGTVHAGFASGWATVTGNVTATMTRATGGTLEERLDRLEERLAGIEEQHQQLAGDLQQEVTDRTRAVRELREHLDAEVARINQALHEQQRVAEEVDARALPVVLGGAFLSTFPELLGGNALVGTLFLCLGVGLFFRAWALLDEARRERP